jgi:hypothetical protein
MQAMPGITALVSRWALSAGTLLAVGGGLALYQMTSLVLGPAGARDLHISLTIPAIDINEFPAPLTSSVTPTLATLAGPSASKLSRLPIAARRASGTRAAHRAAAPMVNPVGKTSPVSPVTPVGSEAPATHPAPRPVPPADPQDQPAEPQDQQTGAE